MKAEPNARVMADREHLLGGLENTTAADHPLDLALARRWITERQHKAGMAFARLHRQMRLDGPVMGSGSPPEVQEGVRERQPVREWSNLRITMVFDRVFDRAGPPGSQAQADEAKWRALCALLTPAERAQVMDVCIRASWPQWIVQRAAGHFDTAWERGRDLLVDGLETIAAALRPPRRPPAAGPAPVEPRPKPKPIGPVREDVTRYETEDGELVREVVVRRRATVQPH